MFLSLFIINFNRAHTEWLLDSHTGGNKTVWPNLFWRANKRDYFCEHPYQFTDQFPASLLPKPYLDIASPQCNKGIISPHLLFCFDLTQRGLENLAQLSACPIVWLLVCLASSDIIVLLQFLWVKCYLNPTEVEKNRAEHLRGRERKR